MKLEDLYRKEAVEFQRSRLTGKPDEKPPILPKYSLLLPVIVAFSLFFFFTYVFDLT